MKFNGHKYESSIKLSFLEKNSEILEDKIDDQREKQKDIAYNLNKLSEVLLQKADSTDISKTQKLMSHYAPLHEFRDLQKQIIEEYTRNDEFEIWQKNVSELRDITCRKIDTKTVKDRFQQFDLDFNKKLMLHVKNQYFDQQLSELRKEMKDVLDRVLLASDDLKTMKSFSEMFSNKLKVKIEYCDLKEGLDSIKSQFDRFWSFDHIKEMQDKINPFIEKVTSIIQNYKIDNTKAKEMIGRFDEILLEKASKFNIEELKIELK